MFGFGIIEIVIVLIIVIVLFGASRLPEIGRGVGEALKNFKKSISETSESDGKPNNKTDQEK
jgi:sec-independent protein translocase protein TatA